MGNLYDTRTETDPEMGRVTVKRRQRRADRSDGGGFYFINRCLLTELVALQLPASSIAIVLEALRQYRMNQRPLLLSTVASQALGIATRSRSRWALDKLSDSGLVTVKTRNGQATELTVTDRLLQLSEDREKQL